MTKFQAPTLIAFAAMAVLMAAPVMAEEKSVESMSSEVNVITPDITSRGVPAEIAIQPNRSVTRTTTTTYTSEEPTVNHYRGYHGRDIIYSEEHVSTPLATSTTVTTVDPLMEDSRIPGVISLEEEANLAISSPAY